jgi:hypothetical protein
MAAHASQSTVVALFLLTLLLPIHELRGQRRFSQDGSLRAFPGKITLMVSTANEITANEMADEAGVPRKTFRRALRKAALPWHVPGTRWTVLRDGNQHADMKAVLNRLRST